MARRPFIVFDCDGTLTDSHHVIVAAMTCAFEDVGMAAPSDGAVRSVIGLSLPVAIEQLLGDANHDDVDVLVDRYKDAFVSLRASGQAIEALYPQVETCLRGLRAAGAVLGIATGKSRRGLDHVLETHGLRDLFETLQTADGNASKPHPEMLERAMLEAGAEPADTVMIGDSPYDMQMAIAARTTAVGVAWTDHGPDALRRSGAHAMLSSYGDWSMLLKLQQAA